MSARQGSVRAIGDVLAGRQRNADQRRTGQPVWRNSYSEGQIEDRVWRPIGGGKTRRARRIRGAVMKSARMLERRTKRERQGQTPGTRRGFLGETGIAVLEALWEIVNFATGRLEPAIATLAERTGYSYSAVHQALVTLRERGFLQWVRRSRPTDNQGEAGPQVEQITNAYALLIPGPTEAFLRRELAEAPLSGDEVERRRSQRAELKEMLDALPLSEFHEATWDGDRLAGETLKRIAHLVQERESSTTRETGRSF